MKSEAPISHIKQRQIQAPVIVSIINELSKTVGEDQALGIVGRAIQQESIDSGRQSALSLGDDMRHLRQYVEQVWCDQDALEIEVLADNAEEFSFNVTRCRYAESYKEMGLSAEYGACLSCNRDKAFIEGFNPDILLTRTDTIMNGASHCDFRFKKK